MRLGTKRYFCGGCGSVVDGPGQYCDGDCLARARLVALDKAGHFAATVPMRETWANPMAALGLKPRLDTSGYVEIPLNTDQAIAVAGAIAANAPTVEDARQAMVTARRMPGRGSIFVPLRKWHDAKPPSPPLPPPAPRAREAR